MVLEHLRERLLCNPESAAQARGMLRRLAAPLPRADWATVSLVLTELVTNVVRYGCADQGAGIGVEIWCAPEQLKISVMQSGPLFDPEVVRQRIVGRERGWGVLILDRVCSSWGVDRQSGTVWAEIDLKGR